LLPLKLVEQLDKEIQRGDSTIVQLANTYSVDAKYVATHVKKCVKKPPKSGHEMLTHLLQVLDTTAKEMRQSYDPEDNPYAMGHFIKLAKEIRETIATLDKLQPSTVLLQKITEQILEPLVREFATITIEEVRRTRTDILGFVGAENAARVDRATKSLTSRMAERYDAKTRDLISKLKGILEEDFGSKAKAKPKRPSVN